MLELRPVGGGGKDAAVASLLAADGLDRAVYAGDDRTDLDAFRRLRELREEGELEAAVCVGVLSPEGAGGAGRRVRPDRRRARRAGWRSSSRWRELADALHRPAPRHRLPHRRRGDGAGGDHRDRAPTATATPTTILVAAAWWLVSLAIGLYLGRPARAADDVRDALARARTATSPAAGVAGPDRLRPALADRDDRRSSPAVLGIFFPGVAVVGAGYALLVSLAWHTREAAVLAIEQRDGVKFYVVPTAPCGRSSWCGRRGCAAGTASA